MRQANVENGFIALVTETFFPEINGVANTLRHLTHGLLRQGVPVQVVRPRQSRLDRSRTEDEIEHITTPGLPLPGYPDLKFGLPAKRQLRRLWKRKTPIALYVATQGPLGWSAVTVARELGIRVVSGFHTNFQTYSRYYGAGFLESIILNYLRWFHNRTDITLVPTQRMQAFLERMGIQRVNLLSRGVDCSQFNPAHRSDELRRQWGVPEHGHAILYVGRLAAEKNLQLAVTCFQRLQATHSRLRFVLVGDGPLAGRLKEKHPDFVFCGMKTGPDLAAHYASGDLFLFPSKTDTFGNVVVEAMASGLAVVSFDDAASAEHIQHEGTGMLSPLDNDDTYIRNGLALVSRPSLLNRVRGNARQHALTLHWDHIVEQFLGYLAPLAQENQTHGTRQSYSTL